MTRTEMLVEVLNVAMLTEDRSATEQRAMLDLALELDKERGAFVSGNRKPTPPVLVADVEATYDPSSGRRVTLSASQRAQYDGLRARWSRCTRCGYPSGLHYADDVCPRDTDPLLHLLDLDAYHAHFVPA